MLVSHVKWQARARAVLGSIVGASGDAVWETVCGCVGMALVVARGGEYFVNGLIARVARLPR